MMTSEYCVSSFFTHCVRQRAYQFWSASVYLSRLSGSSPNLRPAPDMPWSPDTKSATRPLINESLACWKREKNIYSLLMLQPAAQLDFFCRDFFPSPIFPQVYTGSIENPVSSRTMYHLTLHIVLRILNANTRDFYSLSVSSFSALRVTGMQEKIPAVLSQCRLFKKPIHCRTRTAAITKARTEKWSICCPLFTQRLTKILVMVWQSYLRPMMWVEGCNNVLQVCQDRNMTPFETLPIKLYEHYKL